MAQNLTEQLDALIAEHGLASITINRLANSYNPGDCFWSVNAQAVMPDGTREIGTADHDTDPAGALADAIGRLNAKRVKAVSVPVLEVL